MAERRPDKVDTTRHDRGEAPGPLSRRLGWFALYWLAGLAVIFTIAYLIRLVLIG
ncbi:hypothetical protein SAMN06297251_13319 [Fulvimarina manganoxydans]|uniref:DUF2474 domain-containing protein n=1 Tax=Fulvimarina manganoxydans TaxID=937218 RepID=A0A1W2ET36_9HYPH|nr:DUF2474 domain-containing protein [Fulvimarina manganoxydans]SMD12859.1 hypothetical protein SAMN06297251_13319 [Fulvimarina manganoxydans]